jgi:hypothetical protein
LILRRFARAEAAKISAAATAANARYNQSVGTLAGELGGVRAVNLMDAETECPAASVAVTPIGTSPGDESVQLSTEASGFPVSTHWPSSPNQVNWIVPEPPDATAMNVTLNPTVADAALSKSWIVGRGFTRNKIGGDSALNPSESLTSA